MLPDLPLVVRPMQPGDLAFVIDSWVRSLPPPPPWHPLQGDAYLTMMRNTVAATLSRARYAFVLASSEHEATIMGWAVGEPGALHNVYARREARMGAGLAWVHATARAAMGET
jgi:hypothetical protein